MSTTVKVHGLDGIVDTLRAFPKQIQNRSLRRALSAAAKPIQDAMLNRIPKKGGQGSTGALRASIKTVIKQVKKGGGMRATIGPATKASRPRVEEIVAVSINPLRKVVKKVRVVDVNWKRTKGKSRGKVQVNTPTRYAHLVENGFLHRRGSTVTRIAPRPFMRPAWQTQGGQKALDRFADSLRTSVLNDSR